MSGCDYSLHDDNYVEIAPPGEKPVSIDLNVPTNGESLIICKEGHLEFSANAFGEEVVEMTFSMGDKTWITKETTGSLFISETEFPAGAYTLTCELQLKLNDGSIADQHGGRMVYQIAWPVHVDYTMYIPIVRHRINDNRQLELLWEKPFYSHLKIKSYEIFETSGPGRLLATITDENQTSWVDEDYVGERRTYKVNVILDDPEQETLSWDVGAVDVEEVFNIYVDSNDPDFVEIKWEDHIKRNLELYVDKEIVTLEEGQNSLKLPSTGFGSTSESDQYSIEARLSPYNKPSQVSFTRTLVAGCFGKVVSDGWTTYTWNKTENKLYAMNSEYLYSFSVPELSLLKKIEVQAGYTIAHIQADASSNKLAVYYRGNTVGDKKITVYDGSQLNELFSIPCTDIIYDGTSGVQLFSFTTDNKFVYFAREGGSGLKGMVYNADTGAKEKEFDIYAESDIYNNKISPDGKYVCSAEGFVTRVTRLTDYVVTGRTDIATQVQDSYNFNPIDPSELVVANGNEIRIWDAATGAVTRSFSIAPAETLHNIDPLNGNLLGTKEDKLFVHSLSAGQQLLSLKNKASGLWLLGNTLTSNYGMIFNLDKYLDR